jgi:hypothetical protein
MVPSYAITIAVSSDRLIYNGFSLGETIRLRSFEFIVDYFSGVNLSPSRGDSGVALMGSSRNGMPSPRYAMMDDSTEEFLTAQNGEGGSGLPSPRRHTT